MEAGATTGAAAPTVGSAAASGATTGASLDDSEIDPGRRLRILRGPRRSRSSGPLRVAPVRRRARGSGMQRSQVHSESSDSSSAAPTSSSRLRGMRFGRRLRRPSGPEPGRPRMISCRMLATASDADAVGAAAGGGGGAGSAGRFVNLRIASVIPVRSCWIVRRLDWTRFSDGLGPSCRRGFSDPKS